MLGAFGRARPTAEVAVTIPVICGTLLQGASFAAVTLWLPKDPLRPGLFESIATLLLAPAALALFLWAQHFSARGDSEGALVTGGAYGRLRHPMYLAFLLMLLATACVASAGFKMLAAVALYLAGSEMRIFSEETDLFARFREEYTAYRQRTPWRYLPGLR